MKIREIILEARNENSSGRPITNNAVTLKNFWSWFKGSKVVDANKRPMVMYHGTAADFSRFGYEYADTGEGAHGMGFYFTNMPHTASGYAQGKEASINPGSNVIPVYLNISKPMDSNYKRLLNKPQIKQLILLSPNIDDALSNFGDVEYSGKARVLNDAIAAYDDCCDTLLQQLNSIARDFYNSENESFLKAAIAVTGFNGVKHGFEGGEIFYVAWDPSQIKSMVGNVGNYSAGGMVDED